MGGTRQAAAVLGAGIGSVRRYRFLYLRYRVSPDWVCQVRVLGPAIIDHRQQRAIEKGASELLIGRDRVFVDAAERAKVGDLWWIKEPYCQVTSQQFGTVKNINEMIPGSALGMSIPERLKPHWESLRKKPMLDAFGLRRGESRATLRIIEIRPAGFYCAVLMKNVDEFCRKAA